MSDEIIEIVVQGEDINPELKPDKELIENFEVLAEIKSYIDEEMLVAETERTGAKLNWKRWRKQREGVPNEESKDFPWKDASNVRTPGMMGVTITGTNNLETRYDAKKPQWKVTSLNKDFEDSAAALEKLLSVLAEDPNRIDMGRKKHSLLYDTASLGRGYLKGHWEISEWNFKREGESIKKIAHDGPQLSLVSIEDLLTRASVTDLQRAPWYAVRTYYNAHELGQMAAKELFVNVESVLGAQADDISENRKESLKSSGLMPDSSNGDQPYTVWELSMFWDVDGDGVEEDIKLFYHAESGEFLRAEFNDLSVRDIVPFDYYALPFQFYPMGLSWMGDQTQEERDSLHNLAYNSLTLASLQMPITKTGSDIHIDQWTPMTDIEVDDPSNDIRIFGFKDNSSVAMNMENQVASNLSTATGINQAMGGQPDTTMKSRFSPTGYAQQGSVGNAMLEANSKNIDRGFDQAGMLLVYLIVANGERAKANLSVLLPVDLQDDFAKVCDMNVEDIPEKFLFKVQSTRMDETQEAEKQKYTILLQLHDQYGERIIRYLELISNIGMQTAQQPQLEPVFRPMLEAAQKLLAARSKLTEDFLVFMGQLDASSLISYWRDIALKFEITEMQKDAQLQEVEDAIKQQSGQSTNTGTAGGVIEESGVEGLPGQAAGAGESGAGSAQQSQPAGSVQNTGQSSDIPEA